MKCAVILNGDLSAPHLKIYTNIFDEQGVSYDVISWDRGNNFKKSEFTYRDKSTYKGASIVRLWEYVNFSRFITRLIQKHKYDKLVVISPQVALFIPFLLKKKYAKKYIFDYRDLSIEQMAFFKPFMKMVLKNSYVNVISSPGFKKYLPKGFDYVLSHNFDINLVRKAIESEPNPLPEGDVKVLTIGGIRFDANYEVIDSLGNAEGVELSFVGKGGASSVLETYCKEKAFRNIIFKGFYTKKDEGGIIQRSTFINIFYPKIPSHFTALSNRFYNSLIFKRPMIVTKGGIQGSFAEKYNVGLVLENCNDLPNKLKKYMESLNFEDYKDRCNLLLEQFVGDYNKLNKIVLDFLK